MEYQEAVKKVSNRKVKENFLLIEFYYDKKLILPYKEGMAFVGALSNAEQLHEPYSKPKSITPLERDLLKTTILSHTEYEQIKIAQLLKVSLEDVQRFELEAT
jgi:hypothetical protein